MLHNLMVWVLDCIKPQHTPLVHHIVNCGYHSIGVVKNSNRLKVKQLRCMKCNENLPAYLDSNKSNHKQQYITEMYDELKLSHKERF